MSKSEEVDELKDEKKKKKERNLIQTKVIIRRLPIGMNKTQFLEAFQPLPENDFVRFVPGDRSLAPHNYARAYINFVRTDDILTFRDKYDGSELELPSGNKSICVVEYAPFQKIPKKGRKKDDPKVNTITKDADYIKFLETLEVEEEKQSIDIEKFLEELDLRDRQNQKAVETPLTAFVKQRREERKRLREERRRQDIERRRKKDEERRKRREAERKKRIELEKSKRKEKAKDDLDGKKTLGETKREMQENNKVQKPSESHNEDSNKMKILQKREDENKSSKSQNENTDHSANNRYKDSKYRPLSSREYPPRRMKEGQTEQRSGSAKFKDHSTETDKLEDKSKNKKPDREIYQPGASRGRGGSRGGRGSRPQKYSEQRIRSSKKGENDK